MGTFESVTNIVKNTMTESLVHILSPKRRVDILRDAMEAKKQGKPYVITFCGVNGVGKSTNLAKVSNKSMLFLSVILYPHKISLQTIQIVAFFMHRFLFG